MKTWMLLPATFLLSSAAPAGNTTVPPSTVREVAGATVEAGRVFSSGGIDGLILWAMILGTFLMFLVAAFAVWIAFRSHNLAFKAMEAQRVSNGEIFARKDDLNQEQTKMFIESVDRTGSAVQALAVAMASMVQEHQGFGLVMARVEGTDRRIEALLNLLDAKP